MNMTFDRYIADAKANGELEVARRLSDEKRMAGALVTACLARGFSISVYDSCEWTLKRSTNRAEIINALFTSDDDWLRIHDADGKGQGQFWLVYGNSGAELIADYTVTPATDAIWNEVISPLTDKLDR